MKSSPVLLAFYKAWLDPHYVHRNAGLCCNFDQFMTDNFPTIRHDVYREELRTQFIDAGVDTFYPFNISAEDYQRETSSCSCHTNKLRIQWVQDRIKDMEEAQ